MAITIPLNGTFNLTFKLKRVVAGGPAIAGASLISEGGTEHRLVWVEILDPNLDTIYTIDVENLSLNDIDAVNPTITTAGTYNGVGSAWNNSSGSPVELYSGTLPDGAWYVVYKAGTGILEDKQNTISKSGELIVEDLPPSKYFATVSATITNTGEVDLSHLHIQSEFIRVATGEQIGYSSDVTDLSVGGYYNYEQTIPYDDFPAGTYYVRFTVFNENLEELAFLNSGEFDITW